jgi:hypothetical protein
MPAPPAGPGFFPLDERLGLGPGAFTPTVQQGLVRLGTQLPFEQVPEAAAFFLGVAVSRETARRLTERAGGALVALETAAAEAVGQASECPDGPPVQQGSVDGAMVPLVHAEWGEVKTLAIGTVERHANGAVHTTALSYFSRLCDAEQFRELARGEVHRRGTAQAGQVCAVVDGADWCQKFVDWHCPQAVRILDFPHAAGYLSAAAQARWGAGTAAASAWLGKYLHELKHGRPDRVLQALRALPMGRAPQPSEARAVQRQALQYLEARRAQVEYQQFQAAGYPIGSGIVESANKLVVEARLKGSGMHWARAHVNPLVALRGMLCSGRWATDWPPLWARLCRRAPGRPPATAPAPGAPPTRVPAGTARRAVADLPLGLGSGPTPAADHPWRRGFEQRQQRKQAAKT